MPHIDDMYPRPFLDPTKFENGRIFVGTVKEVRFYRAFVNSQTGVEEPVWMLDLHEFPKPMKLSGKKCRIIAQLLGTKKTEEWVGRRLGFFRGIEDVGGRIFDVFIVDQRLPEPLAPMLDPASPTQYFNPAHGQSFVPKQNMDRFLEHLKAAGKSWDAFLKWLKSKDNRAALAAFGVGLDEVPASIVPAMKVYLDECRGVNTATGEVTTEPPRLAPPPTEPPMRFQPPAMGRGEPVPQQSRPAAPAPTQTNPYSHPDANVIDPDDIPF